LRKFVGKLIIGLSERYGLQVLTEFLVKNSLAGPEMKSRLRALQAFLFLAGSFLVLGFSSYSYCCNLTKLDLRFQDLSLENLEEDNTGIHRVYALKISISDSCFDLLLLIRDLPKQFPLIDLLKPCLDQRTIALRC
jgi:hypothetical protein